MFWTGEAENGGFQKEKREQAPAPDTHLSTGSSIVQIRDLSRPILKKIDEIQGVTYLVSPQVLSATGQKELRVVQPERTRSEGRQR
jgi:hypothetical protein